MRPRLLALLALGLLAALGLAAGPASAASPRAPLTAVQNADGTRSLRLELQGTSDSINILPHLRCGVDQTATGVFAGSSIPCIWMVDHKAPFTSGPEGCPSTGQEYASWRCDMRLFRDVTIDAAEAGESSLIMFNTKSAGGSGICAWIPLALRTGSGKGTVQANDGCRERIVCSAGYDGQINADALDVVTGCKNVKRSGSSAPIGTGAGSSSGGSGGDNGSNGGSGLDLSQCTGAGSGKKGDSPLYSVEVKKRGRRGMRIRVYMRRAVPITVEVRVKTRSGSQVVRSVPRCATRGENWVTVPNATTSSGRRNYRVYVRSNNSTYPLRSSYEALPRR